MFHKLPSSRPATALLDTINSPEQLRELEKNTLPQLAKELREFLLYSVGQTGGHFSAGLGVVELTIALHYALNTPSDSLIWDVGHQAYPHKILTGRREAMASMRQLGGLSPFPSIQESHYDAFGVGHSSTSISAALGIAIANQLNGNNQHAVAVIGDGAMTAGIAFEALNHAAHTGANLLVVLNDNTMSISHNVGGLADYLARNIVGKEQLNDKAIHTPATIFEDLGLKYLGPCDGHDIGNLIHKIQKALNISGPKILHIKTKKGYGYAPAADDPIAYHALNKIEAASSYTQKVRDKNRTKFQDVFGNWLCQVAADDSRIIGITPAMPEGSGMNTFAQQFPNRFFDVAIAEQHALTFAAGLARAGKKPIVAIYSTFLQRAYDQLIHDIALQNLDVTIAIDRAGIVGEDGTTHMGNFDISYTRSIPNIVLACPSDENECHQLLHTALNHAGPAAVRYPRGFGPGTNIIAKNLNYPLGKAKALKTGSGICVLNFGPLLDRIQSIAEENNFSLYDMRWIKPLDTELLHSLCSQYQGFITLEENVLSGGAGSAILEFLNQQNKHYPTLCLGLPDAFIEHGLRKELLDKLGFDYLSISKKISIWRKNNNL